MRSPFEVRLDELQASLDDHVDAIFGSLESDFLVMPKGKGFVEFAVFDAGYEALKRATHGFRQITPDRVAPVVFDHPISMIVLRCILGFTPPEWAYCATRLTGVAVSQGAARTIDRDIRIQPTVSLTRGGGLTEARVRALIETACHFLRSGAPDPAPDTLHRLDKADTRAGSSSLHSVVALGVPYSMLLYERLLGRPFAGHRDSVSELIGDIVENAIDEILTRAGISFRRMKRAESVPGFDQAPDFFVPSEYNPQVVIEAKLTEDDGTARDKVTRVQHLDTLSRKGQSGDRPRFEVVACIAGRGFAVRREDMKKLLLATRGKVFTLQNLQHLIGHTRLAEFRSHG